MNLIDSKSLKIKYIISIEIIEFNKYLNNNPKNNFNSSILGIVRS